MALAQQISTITCSQVEFGIDNADYFTIYAFEADSTIGVGYSEKKYYVWFDHLVYTIIGFIDSSSLSIPTNTARLFKTPQLPVDAAA